MIKPEQISPHMINPAYGVIIRKGKGEKIPIGAKPISLNNIISIQKRRIANWVPKEDVWAVQHGLKLSVIFTALTSTASLIYIRRFFQLHAQKIPTTFFPTVIVPSAIGALFHDQSILGTLLEGTYQSPLKLEFKGSVVQILSGSIFPLVISYAICIPVAKMEKSYSIPKLSEYRKFFDMWKFSIARGRNAFVSMGVLNCLVGFFLVNRMINCVTIMEKRDNYIYDQLLEKNNVDYNTLK